MIEEINFQNVNVGVPRCDGTKIDLIEKWLKYRSVYFTNEGGDKNTYNINAGFDDLDESKEFQKLVNDVGCYFETESFNL